MTGWETLHAAALREIPIEELACKILPAPSPSTTHALVLTSCHLFSMIFWQHSSASRFTSLSLEALDISCITLSFTPKAVTCFLPSGWAVTNSPRSWHATATVVASPCKSRHARSAFSAFQSPCSNLRTFSDQNLGEWMKPHLSLPA